MNVNEKKCIYIKKQVEAYFDIPDVGERIRKRELSYCRNVYSKLCMELTRAIYRQIGMYLNTKEPFDHSSITHHVKSFNDFSGQPFFRSYDFAYTYLKKKIIPQLELIDIDEDLETTETEAFEIKQFYRLRLFRIIEQSKKVIDNRDEEINKLKSRIEKLNSLIQTQ